MADIIQIRRDLSTNWTTSNPVLADGELGFEKNTKKGKLGDGITAWNSLPYSFTGESINVAEQITAAASKTTPVDADQFGITDSAAGNILKKLSWANIKATLLTYFNAIYEPVFAKGTLVQGSNVTLTGTLTNRLVGTGNVTIAATAGTTVELVTPAAGVNTVGAVKYNGNTRTNGNFYNENGGIPNNDGNALLYNGKMQAGTFQSSLFFTEFYDNIVLANTALSSTFTVPSGSTWLVSILSKTVGVGIAETLLISNSMGTVFNSVLRDDPNVFTEVIAGTGFRIENRAGSTVTYSINITVINKVR
jgi:hypothetical protein